MADPDTMERTDDAPAMQPGGDALVTLLAELIEAIGELTRRTAPKEFMTDAQIIERLGVPEKIAYDRFRFLDDRPHLGFPQKQKLWGDRRSWRAVKAYFRKTSGLNGGIDAARFATENRARTRLPRRHLTAEPRGGHPHD